MGRFTDITMPNLQQENATKDQQTFHFSTMTRNIESKESKQISKKNEQTLNSSVLRTDMSENHIKQGRAASTLMSVKSHFEVEYNRASPAANDSSQNIAEAKNTFSTNVYKRNN